MRGALGLCLTVLVASRELEEKHSRCSESPGGDCWSSLCCEQPSGEGPFGCFQRRGHPYAQCRPLYGWENHLAKKKGTCEDGEWICPASWIHEYEQKQGQCSDTLGDCTHSLCCANPESKCFRKRRTYYAQCKAKETTCFDWHDRRTSDQSIGWACPGWEVCSDNYQECTLSRCCQSHDFTCVLNATAKKSSGWYAECRPIEPPEVPGEDMGPAACGDGTEWRCAGAWMKWENSLSKEVGDMETMHPLATAAIVILSVVSALCAICYGMRAYDRNRRAQSLIVELQTELEVMKASRPPRLQDRILEVSGGQAALTEDGSAVVAVVTGIGKTQPPTEPETELAAMPMEATEAVVAGTQPPTEALPPPDVP